MPPRVEGLSLNQLPSSSVNELVAYLETQEYITNWDSGVGLYLHGHGLYRSELIQLVARMFVYAGSPAYYTTATNLLYSLSDDEATSKLRNTPNLFIDHFEKKFQDDGCPYSLSECNQLEEFLLSRRGPNRTTSFTGHYPIGKFKWWTEEFQLALNSMVVSFHIV